MDVRHREGGMTSAIKCGGCGKFIPYEDCLDGARYEFEPLSEFGPERSEWICKRCVKAEQREAA
jgi:hypothetical protein